MEASPATSATSTRAPLASSLRSAGGTEALELSAAVSPSGRDALMQRDADRSPGNLAKPTGPGQHSTGQHSRDSTGLTGRELTCHSCAKGDAKERGDRHGFARHSDLACWAQAESREERGELAVLRDRGCELCAWVLCYLSVYIALCPS